MVKATKRPLMQGRFPRRIGNDTVELADPCSCGARCPEGERCLAGHSWAPGKHWFACDVCSPRDILRRLPDGEYELVLHACGHVVPVESPPWRKVHAVRVAHQCGSTP
jgi:hypothetical protein